MTIQRSQNSPVSSVANAKWRAKISTHVSRILSQRACIKNRVVSTSIQEQIASKINMVKLVI